MARWQDVDLIGREADGEAPTKTCLDCSAIVPLGVPECPLCGYLFAAAGPGGGGQLAGLKLKLMTTERMNPVGSPFSSSGW